MCAARRRSPGAGRASTPAAASERGAHRRERLAARERRRADEVEPEIEVAELEPRVAAPLPRRLERAPGLARPAPAALLVVEAGERVEHGVEVGRDVQAEHLEVVADVAHHGEARPEDVVETARELCASDAAREADDLHRAIASTSARVRAPPRGPSPSRSASVSTSATRFGSASSSKSRPSSSTCARKRARAVRPVERPEDLGVRQSQSVRPSVGRRDERDPAEPRRHGEGGEVGRAHAREIRVDDQADAVDALERGCDRRALALAGVVDRGRAELAGDEAAGGVRRHDPHLADGVAASTTSPSIARATSRRSSSGSRLLPSSRNGITTSIAVETSHAATARRLV